MRYSKRKIYFVAISLALIAGLIYMSFSFGFIRFNYPSEKDYPIRGIDISHHQKEINWQELKTERVDFVYIKATEGSDHKDRLFTRNLEGAKFNGYKTGAYHFFLFCKSPKEQAENFIETVPISACDLPPAIDIEFGGFCKVNENETNIIPDLEFFLSTLAEYYGKTPILYTTNNFHEKYLQNKLMKYPLWIRSVFGEPELKDGRKWTFWQYTDKGKLKGIKGEVDLNVFLRILYLFKRICLSNL